MEFGVVELVDAVAARVPERPAVLYAGAPVSYAALVERTRRLARVLRDAGLGAADPLPAGPARVSDPGQDTLAQFLHNGPEYLEGMLGGYRARLAPFNVNYRYRAEELRYQLADARAGAVQYHASLGPVLAEALTGLSRRPLLLHVEDGSGTPPVAGAVDYEAALAAAPAEVDTTPSPDDLYLLYTGGTTGQPKGVMWRQADALVALAGLVNRRAGREWESVAERVDAISRTGHRIMPLAPLIHGASQFAALEALCSGNTLVFPDEVRRFDPADALEAAIRHGVTVIMIVGDAFAGPLLDELAVHPRALPALRVLTSGGAALGPERKQQLVAALPGLRIVENIGASETGPQGTTDAVDGGPITFRPGPGTAVLAEDLSAPLPPGHPGTGWLASVGRIPLGYLHDPEKSARTFPTVGGQRCSVPGDRARLRADGRVELLGRDSATINTGGEKVFAEEVENAIRAHPGVADAVVCGRPSERWGSEVTALVRARPGTTLTAAEVVGFCAPRLAGYKLPKAVLFVDEVHRTPSGKPDYRWARAAAQAG